MKNENPRSFLLLSFSLLLFFSLYFQFSRETEEHARGVRSSRTTSGLAILITINHTCPLRRMTHAYSLIRISFGPLFSPTMPMSRCLFRQGNSSYLLAADYYDSRFFFLIFSLPPGSLLTNLRWQPIADHNE